MKMSPPHSDTCIKRTHTNTNTQTHLTHSLRHVYTYNTNMGAHAYVNT